MSEHSPLSVLHRRLHEAYSALWDSLVDPREALYDDDGTRWLELAGPGAGGAARGPACATEAQHRDIRSQCRALAAENEFAINGHENRVSYIVGPGHSYRAAPHKQAGVPREVAAALAAAVQEVLDAFLRDNQWRRRQQELVLRTDRDGEAFLRFFLAPDGTTRVRFIEPGQVATPPELASLPAATFGILTDRDDVESVEAYYVDGSPMPAADVQHRKANVDANVKRGLPLFYPVRKNLRRAEKLLRNMSVVAEIQSAIALIRRHRAGSRSAVEQFVGAWAETAAASPASRSAPLKRYAPGTILDAPADVEYDFPAAGVDAAAFVTVLQAELRAVASRLVMPEFMLTSDASNANYSSTMIAEGPAVRMFARLQAQQIEDDLAVMRRVVDHAVAAGRLPPDARTLVDISAVAPSLAVRDRLKEAQALRIEAAAGILSPQSWSQRAGLDYDQEQANLAEHRRT